MSTNMQIFLAALCLMAVILKTQAAEPRPLQCWQCSSETEDSKKFCDADFSEDDIPDKIKERNISALRYCNSTINSEHERPVCRKTVEEVNGKTVTKRFCYYTNKLDPLNHCSTQPTESNVNRVFCEDCLTDRCNSATQTAGRFGVLLLPVIIAKSFIF